MEEVFHSLSDPFDILLTVLLMLQKHSRQKHFIRDIHEVMIAFSSTNMCVPLRNMTM